MTKNKMLGVIEYLSAIGIIFIVHILYLVVPLYILAFYFGILSVPIFLVVDFLSLIAAFYTMKLVEKITTYLVKRGEKVKNPFKTKYTYKVTAFNENGETIPSKKKRK